MFHSTNSNVNFCDVCDLSFETKKDLYKLHLYDSKQKELLEKTFGSDDEAPIDVKPKVEKVISPSPQPIPENMERVHEEEYYFVRPKPKTLSKPETESKFKGASSLVTQTESIPKDNTKDIFKTKPITKPKTKTEDSIYSRIKYVCTECHSKIKHKIALTTHSYSHNRKYLENTEYIDITSSQNMKEFYITDKAGNSIEDIDEAINNSLEEIKNCYQFRKVKRFKYKITAKCEYKRRTKEEVKTTKIFFNTDYVINNVIYENGDKQWLNFEKEIYEGYGYDYEFLGLRSIQIIIEPTKASVGSYIDSPPPPRSQKLNRY